VSIIRAFPSPPFNIRVSEASADRCYYVDHRVGGREGGQVEGHPRVVVTVVAVRSYRGCFQRGETGKRVP